MKRLILNTKRNGMTSIEIVIGVSIAGIVLVYSMYAIMEFVNSARDISAKTEALYLAEDGLELVRYIRDNDWANISSLSVNNTHYLQVTTTTVQTTASPEIVDTFSRSFRIQNVYRNPGNEDIIASTTGGAVVDTGSKYVTMTVSWGTPVKSVSLTTIIADISS